MAKFRKKPVVIEAMRWDLCSWIDDPTHSGVLAFFAWIGGKDAPVRLDDERLLIRTLEGEMYADPGDWVICGVKGELYPCKPDIFAATYEALEESSDGPV